MKQRVLLYSVLCLSKHDSDSLLQPRVCLSWSAGYETREQTSSLYSPVEWQEARHAVCQTVGSLLSQMVLPTLMPSTCQRCCELFSTQPLCSGGICCCLPCGRPPLCSICSGPCQRRSQPGLVSWHHRCLQNYTQVFTLDRKSNIDRLALKCQAWECVVCKVTGACI